MSNFDSNSTQAENVTFPSGGQQIAGHLCRADGDEKRGSVIVIPEIFGLTDHIKDVACRLAQAGYTALAVNFYTREGEPPSIAGGFDALMAFAAKIPDAQVIGDLTAASAYLRARPESNGKVGVIGFCWGGYYAMLSAAEVPNLNAVVAYYGRIRLAQTSANKPQAPMELVAQMTAPLQGHFGAADRSIPATDADALRDALQAGRKPGEIYVYAGAGHAFNNDTRESYNAGAAQLAWQRTQDWLAKYL